MLSATGLGRVGKRFPVGPGPGRPPASAPEAGGCAAPEPPQQGRDAPSWAAHRRAPQRRASPKPSALLPARTAPAAVRWATGAETCSVKECVFQQVGVTAQKTMRLLPASGRKATQKVVAVGNARLVLLAPANLFSGCGAYRDNIINHLLSFFSYYVIGKNFGTKFLEPGEELQTSSNCSDMKSASTESCC